MYIKHVLSKIYIFGQISYNDYKFYLINSLSTFNKTQKK